MEQDKILQETLVRLGPVFEKTDVLLAEQSDSAKPVIIAIDGRCCAGKTTMAAAFAKVYDCNVFHMDYFFLRPEQRTRERLTRPGENVDHERFLCEVLLPIFMGQEVRLRKYDCHEGVLEDPVTFRPRKLTLIEGSYSLHPSLAPYYDLRAFAEIGEKCQKERVIVRNPEMAERFFKQWIPLEEAYFAAFQIREKADLIV